MLYDFAVIGGGIVGLATAHALTDRFPGASLLLLEKESTLAAHQTGRNSGVIHSGIYYQPGSLKAQMAKAGAASMAAFCQQNGIPYDICGKLIVATTDAELPGLDRLYQRGLANGIPVERITPERARDLEPHVRCLAAVHVKSTGICGYRAVTAKLSELVQAHGTEIHPNCLVKNQLIEPNQVRILTTSGDFFAKQTINCAGLQSDRLARSSGAGISSQIVPFRGEYFELTPEKRHLVRGLIYPVPNPDFPFLGVHYTRMIDGSVHCGPNAVLAWKREGYFKSSISLPDLFETLTFPGFWRLAFRYPQEGTAEILRSLLKPLFVKSLQQLIPDVTSADLVPCAAGVRAQALRPDGALVDDFLILQQGRATHVLNAPSPAATASLEIGRHIANAVQP